jgi:hypothetical protein
LGRVGIFTYRQVKKVVRNLDHHPELNSKAGWRD